MRKLVKDAKTGHRAASPPQGKQRAGKGPVHHMDAHGAAVKLFGDSIAANMFLLGYAYQLGHLPIGAEAVEEAIVLNGAAVEMSRNAFRFGRLAARDMATVERMMGAATVIQLGDLVNGSYQPFGAALRDILPRERRHAELGEEGLRNLAARGDDRFRSATFLTITL